MNRYLKGNAMPWLLEAGNADVRYLALKGFSGDSGDGVQLEEEYKKRHGSPFFRKMYAFSRQGVMGDVDRFDILYRGTMWYFAEAIVRGYDTRENLVESTALHILDRYQTESGGFFMNWKPQVEVACRTGDMVSSLLQAGLRDERIDRGVRWICGHQRHDGGWLHCPVSGSADMLRLLLLGKPGAGLLREHDMQCRSCVPASAACLSALIVYRDLCAPADNASLTEYIRKGVEFFLSNYMFSRSNSETMPVCMRSPSKADYARIGFPIMSQYDLLYGSMIIARAGFSSDGRFGEAFNAIVLKQNDDGSWNSENNGDGMLRDEDHITGKKSKWVTLNALRMLRYAGVLDGISIV